MGHPRRVIALVSLGTLGSIILAAVLARVSMPQRVYSVPQVASGLAHNPRVWMGRTVLVRGTALLLNRDECTGGHDQNGLNLVDRLGWTGQKRSTLCLQVNTGALSPAQETIFHLPFIGPSLVGYQHIALGQPQTYRVVFPRDLPTLCHAWPVYSGPWPCLAVVSNSGHH